MTRSSARRSAAEEGTYRYFVLHLACTFDPVEGEEFERAWVGIT